MAGVVALALGCAAPAFSQDWLISPTPAIPLHVPVTPPPSQAVAPPPAVVLPTPAPPSPVVLRAPDALQRLLDPYGLAIRPTSVTPPPSAPPLPAASIAPGVMWTVPPDGSSAMWRRAVAPTQFVAPPLVAFPTVPVTWLLGF
ncbi:MAG TPA: hypothetical protein VFA27_00760 [Vicinamibacterales bacterium]|nr:hypothetical protein [Vicinamibacterales bacterium]